MSRMMGWAGCDNTSGVGARGMLSESDRMLPDK